MNKSIRITACVLCLGAALGAMSARAAVNINETNAKPKAFAHVGEANTQTLFTKAIEDLPIMPNLELVENDDVLFIKKTGRIAQTTLKGPVDIDSVYVFYEQTLPQLGWKQVNPKLYARESELLRVEASSANAEGLTFVRFSVEPEVVKK